VTHCFRLKFCTPETSSLDIAEKQIPIGPRPYYLKTLGDKNIRDSNFLVLLGGGYPDEIAARKDAERAKEALLYASAMSQLSVDCGDDRPRGHMGRMLKLELEKQSGKKICDDVHGIAVYPEGDEKVFLGISVEASVARNPEPFKTAFNVFLDQCGTLNERQMAALELLNGFHFESPPTNRLLLALTAIEVLCERRKRDQSFLDLVDSLLPLIDELRGSAADKSKLRDILGREKTESIRAACKTKIGETLGQEAAEEFDPIYKLRSDFLHNGKRLPRHSSAPTDAYELARRLLDSEIARKHRA
jgi:hypothetical protein